MSIEHVDDESARSHQLEAIADVVEHELFPDVDLALRRGRHIDREDAAWYGFLTDAQAPLERFYRRFGAELVQRTDGFFFLLPSGDKLGRRHLSPIEMLVGQGLTLLYLEPATVEQGGITSRDQLLSQLSSSMGTEQLMLAFNPKKKRMDERVAQELVRSGVSQAVRRLASLGFVELLPEERIRLRSSLMRFAEPVRGSGAELEALAQLVASGEVALTSDLEEPDAPEGDTVIASPPEPAAWNEGAEWGASFAAGEEALSDSSPGEEGFGDLSPGEEAPGDGLIGDEAPGEEALGDEPFRAEPSGGAPVERDAPADDLAEDS